MTDGSHYVVNVEAAIYRDGEYLLVERAAGEEHASGQLALVGGKVEGTTHDTGAFKRTVHREVREEVDVAVTGLTYVQSNAFVADTGAECLNVVFLARHDGGAPTVAAPEEVAATHWLAPADVESHPDCPEWTAAFVARAEERRQSLGW
ncbi:NUDIX domain-containing protein [Haloarchaeobius iranensis]|uniref:ADP-ribose pyrophosphatase YjhB, NUDIX family n=1 Tax=Haloarchaeobius iranensis TaxID=996166 RepID=A0A1G9XR85_9EURY|nr:NUDIX domain-containing protein [Haloarchaeobius iranensis]SDM99230.1 ADP-ribose pyrophosphatase YjhB, NUDIX family [Haloarchaeobius iranensis]